MPACLPVFPSAFSLPFLIADDHGSHHCAQQCCGQLLGIPVDRNQGVITQAQAAQNVHISLHFGQLRGWVLMSTD